MKISTKKYTLFEEDRNEGVVRVISEKYNAGREFLFDGRWISPSDIEEIHIIATESTSDKYESTDDYDDVFDVRKNDVTRLWIQKQPQKVQGGKSKRHQGVLGKNVFIVHGRDHEPMQKLKAMLYEFGLNPIVLHEQPSGSRTIVEKLERYSDVGYTFVILTPDDTRVTSNKEEEEYAHSISAKMTDCTMRVFKAREKGDMRKVEEIRDEFIKHAIDFQGHVENVLGSFELRARQNVILEFGYFIGLLNRDRVCCLLKGNVERPSDMHGIVYIPFKDSIEEIRLKIMKELKEAGYEIKL